MFRAISVSLVSAVLVFCNSLIIATYIKFPIQRDVTKKVILHLAITDCMGAVTLFITIITQHTILSLGSMYLQSIENEACSFCFCITLYLATVSLFFVSFANFERYIAICRRSYYVRIMTKRTLTLSMVTFWIFPVVTNLVPMVNRRKWNGQSVDPCSFYNLLSPAIYLTFSAFVILTILTSLILYSNVLLKAREINKRVQISNGSNAKSDEIGHKRKSLRNSKIVGILTIVVTICWTPVSIASFLIGIGIEGIPEDVLTALFMLGALNSLVNPFIYAWQRKELRQGVLRLLRCNQTLNGQL